MNSETIAKLLESEEGTTVEFKRSLSVRDAIARTICAFANSSGGYIVIGVELKGGDKKTVVGIESAEFEKLPDIISQLSPRPYYSLAQEVTGGKPIGIITIDPLPISEICFYKKLAYRRVGPTNEEISQSNLVKFLQQRGTVSFEENRSQISMAQIDSEKLNKLLKNRGINAGDHKPLDTRSVLASLGVANNIGDFFLKNSAALFFAKDIKQFFLNSEIRIIGFKGKTKSLTAKVSDVRFIDTLPELLESSYSEILKKIGTTSKLVNGKRVDLPSIPEEVLREALTNAVGHRDYFDPNQIYVEIYDDRIEITNPGGLVQGLSLKNFRDMRKARNPTIYRLLNDSRWGEGLNLGIKAIYRIMRQSQLPDPLFEDLGAAFKVTLYNSLSDKKVRPYGLISNRQEKAIEYLKEHGESITAPKYSTLFGVSHPTAIKDLKELVVQGILKHEGSQRSSRYLLDQS